MNSRKNSRNRFLSLIAASLLGMLLGGCANDGRLNHPGPPHPGAANPWATEGGWGPGPNYPATGH
jgi:hypothetical protein